MEVRSFGAVVGRVGTLILPSAANEASHLYYIYHIHPLQNASTNQVFSFYLRFTSQFGQHRDRVMFGYAQDVDSAKSELFILLHTEEKSYNMSRLSACVSNLTICSRSQYCM